MLCGLQVSRPSLATAALLLLPALAQAEVLDKEPSIKGLWGLTAVFGFLGLRAWTRNPRWGTIITIIALCFVASTYLEINDTTVSAAIVREGGHSYLTQAYLSMGTCLGLQFLGIALYLRRRSSNPIERVA